MGEVARATCDDIAVKVSGLAGSMGQAAKSMDSDTKKSMAKGIAAGAAKDVGRGILRGLLKK